MEFTLEGMWTNNKYFFKIMLSVKEENGGRKGIWSVSREQF